MNSTAPAPARLHVAGLPVARFLGFGAVGLGVFAAGEALLYTLVQLLGMEPHLAYLIQGVFGVEASFWLNRTVNWRDRAGSLPHQLVTFHVTKVGTLILNQALFACLLAVRVQYLLDMMLCTALITVVNYIANDRLVFTDGKTPAPGSEAAGASHTAPGSHAPSVAVVIPARNSRRTIRECVRSVLAQEYPNFHIYIVGNRTGADNTWEALGDCPADARVTYLEWPRPASWHGRDSNAKRAFGARAALDDGADLVAFLDSQVAATSHWLATAVGLLDASGVDGVAGISRRRPDDGSLAALYQDGSLFSEWPRYATSSLLDRDKVHEASQLPITANLILRAEALRRPRMVWPTDCPYGWEDFHLDYVLLLSGATLLCTDELCVHRLHRSKFRLAKHVTAGMAAVDFYRKFPSSHFVRRRLAQAALVAAGVPAVLALIAVGVLVGWPSLSLAVLSSLLMVLLLLAVKSVEQARDWRAVMFPFLDVLHIGLWVLGASVAIFARQRTRHRVSDALLAMR
jgi:putative flippase GtrA/GT2 family glycosyltransferase